jgi:hypothetical protein
MKTKLFTILCIFSLQISISQNVGIGTINPISKLEVIGDSTSAQPALIAKLSNVDNQLSTAIVGNAIPSIDDLDNGVGGTFYGGFSGIRAFGFGKDNVAVGVYTEASTSGSGESFGLVATAINSINDNPSYGVYGASSNNNGYGVFSYGMLGVLKPYNQITATDPMVQIQLIGQGTTYLNVIDMIYKESANQGCRLVARNTMLGGLNVVNSDSMQWAPIHAASYNIASDERLKKNIQPIKGKYLANYLKEFRNIQTARYYYNQEFKNKRAFPHIGVIAQTMPKETIVLDHEHTDGSGEQRLHVSISDWLGLVTVVVKENDRRIMKLETENKKLKERLLRLEKMVLEINNK